MGPNRRFLSLEKSRLQPVAGNGLLDRRAFLSGGAAMAAGFTAYALARPARAQPLKDDPWSLGPGNLTGPYEHRSRFEDKVVRTLSNPKGEPRGQNARTPLHLMQGTITPAGLHFVVSQAGSPDIDPDQHRLVIHGLVKRPLVFTVVALARSTMVSLITFLLCGDNRATLFSQQPIQTSV